MWTGTRITDLTIFFLPPPPMQCNMTRYNTFGAVLQLPIIHLHPNQPLPLTPRHELPKQSILKNNGKIPDFYSRPHNIKSFLKNRINNNCKCCLISLFMEGSRSWGCLSQLYKISSNVTCSKSWGGGWEYGFMSYQFSKGHQRSTNQSIVIYIVVWENWRGRDVQLNFRIGPSKHSTLESSWHLLFFTRKEN